jgi:hypothetical protein
MCDVPLRVGLLALSDQAEAAERGEACESMIADGSSREIPPVDGRTGKWFTFRDRFAESTTIAPDPDQPFEPTGGVARIHGEMGMDEMLPAATLGIHLTEPPSPYDASRYSGIAFDAKSDGEEVTVWFHVLDRNTAPLGGECSGCPTWFGAFVTPTRHRKTFEVPFELLKAPRSREKPRATSADSSGLITLAWYIYGGLGERYDISVRNVRFEGCAEAAAVARQVGSSE